MPITLAQNFYKETVAIAWTTGAGNFYVSTKPTISSGYLVVSPNSASLREIVKFTATGTDGSGDYVTITAPNRGLGGTTEQAHSIGETVYINFTAQNLQEISDAIDAIVAGGALDASTTTKGILKLSTAPASATNPIAVGDNDTRIPSTAITAALVGAGATPTGSNKFLTQDDVSSNTLFPPIQVVNFTASGTWTKDAGLKYVVVEVQGSGANGTNATGTAASDNAGDGGGSGGYSRKLILASALGATETVTIGAANGTTDTTFGSHATGGYASGTSRGTASGGDLNISGQQGTTAMDPDSDGDYKLGGFGGDSRFGFGGRSSSQSGTRSASGYGAGGAGGYRSSGETGGGAGTAGIVIVTEYYS